MIGQRISNYSITSLIGEGGMGAVYLGEHEMIGRKVAIKLLKRQLADDEQLIARFFNEARALSAIHHPGMVEVMDVGRMPDGVPYLVMELLAGEALARRLERGRLPIEQALDVGGQLTSVLAAAHARGIIHRDLKPDNVFLCPDAAGRERVKVLDFGIAKLRSDVPQANVQTRTGAIMGTPAYMSPEQCRGVSRQIDHRTDIYSLGVILYQMVIGRLPFASEGIGELIVMHLRDPPPLPSSILPGVPRDLEELLLRALAKDPEARFQRMDDLGAALARIASGRPATLDPGAERLVLGATAALPSVQPAHTTFSSSTGQRDVVTTPMVRPRRGRWVALAVAACAVATAGVLLVGRRSPPKGGHAAGVPIEVPRPPPAPEPRPIVTPPPAPPIAAEAETDPSPKGTARDKTGKRVRPAPPARKQQKKMEAW